MGKQFIERRAQWLVTAKRKKENKKIRYRNNRSGYSR